MSYKYDLKINLTKIKVSKKAETPNIKLQGNSLGHQYYRRLVRFPHLTDTSNLGFVLELAELHDNHEAQESMQKLVDAARELDHENKQLKAHLTTTQIKSRKQQLNTQCKARFI